MKEIMLIVAMQVLNKGVPYRWGGECLLQGMDCSGMVQYCLRAIGKDPKGDQSSQGLYDHFAEKALASSKVVRRGDLLFFGKSEDQISHVAIAIDQRHMIEMGGGNAQTVTYEDAIRDNAHARIMPIARRNDFIGSFDPCPEENCVARI